MACQAAREEVLRQLPRIGYTPMTAHDVWREIKWWTKETIREALSELMRAGDVWPTQGGNYWRLPD